MNYVFAYGLFVVGIALVFFAVANAFLIFSAPMPRTSYDLRVGSPDKPIEISVEGMPDLYYLGHSVIKAVLLLTIGLIGARIFEIGIKQIHELRERRKYEYYYQYQY